MIIDFSKILETKPNAINEFETKVLNFINEWNSDKKTVKIQTSGSTGKPKILDIEKSKMLNSAKMTCDFLTLEKGNSALLCLPVEYISGKMMIVRSILKNLKLHISEPSLRPLKNLNENIDFCAMTPLQVENSLDKLYLIKNLIIGGASISQNLREKIQMLKTENQMSEIKIFETYGMSETLSHIALKQIFPNPKNEFTIFDEIEISLDKRGCLCIFAPKLNSEILQTNDLVKIINKKQFCFLGRIDNVINSGGAKIFPEELENLVKAEIPNEAVFLGIDDQKLGQKLVLIIEGKTDENLKSKISNLKFQKSFHKPKEIVFVEKIPRTETGKVSRIQLKELILKQ